MPQTIYLPQRPSNPMMAQMTGFLWQLAMAKAQHKLEMEEMDRLLNLKKIEAEEERARKQAELKESREYTEKRETVKERSRLAAEGQKVTPVATPEEQEALAITGAPAMEPPAGQVYSPLAKGYIKPSAPKSKTSNWQRKTRIYSAGKEKWAQDYDFNPVTRKEVVVGKPYKYTPEGKKPISTRDPMLDLQRLSKEYKTPDSFMERIVLSPGKKKQNLNSWLMQRGRLAKQGKYTQDELINETMAIMADLGYPPQYHDTVAIMLTDPKIKASEIMQFIREIKDEELIEPE